MIISYHNTPTFPFIEVAAAVSYSFFGGWLQTLSSATSQQKPLGQLKVSGRDAFAVSLLFKGTLWIKAGWQDPHPFTCFYPAVSADNTAMLKCTAQAPHTISLVFRLNVTCCIRPGTWEKEYSHPWTGEERFVFSLSSYFGQICTLCNGRLPTCKMRTST